MGLSRGVMVRVLDSQYPGGRCDNGEIEGANGFQVRTLAWTRSSYFFFMLFFFYSKKIFLLQKRLVPLLDMYISDIPRTSPLTRAHTQWGKKERWSTVEKGSVNIINNDNGATIQVLMAFHFSPVYPKHAKKLYSMSLFQNGALVC